MQDRYTGIQPVPMEVTFDQLTDLENPSPIVPEMVNVAELRKKFVETGFNIEIGELERTALSQTKFRGYESGKGAAVATIIDKDNVSILEAKLLKLSVGGPKIISKKTGEPIEGSENRGLRQFTARLLAVSLGVISPEDFCEATNKAVWKGLKRGKRGEEKQRLAEIFTRTPEPKKTTSSIPPGSIGELYRFLINGLKD